MIKLKYELSTAVKKFVLEMRKRLYGKQRLGWDGWNSEVFKTNIERRMLEKNNLIYSDKINRKKHLVDIANFAMMLYNMENE